MWLDVIRETCVSAPPDKSTLIEKWPHQLDVPLQKAQLPLGL